MSSTIKPKTGTTAQWQASGRVLEVNEWGVEETENGHHILRIGDGERTFDKLPAVFDAETFEELMSQANTIIEEARSAAEAARVASESITSRIAQTTGESETLIMSQRAVSDIIEAHDFKDIDTNWRMGGISSSAGKNQASLTRIRTTWFIRNGVTHIEPAEGYKYMLFVYSKDDGSYIGVWNGTEVANTATWLGEKIDITTYSKEYLFRVVLAKTNDGNISTDDGINLIFTYLTDGFLSAEGVPADAKVVGNYAEDQRMHGVVDLCKSAAGGDAETNGVTIKRNFDNTWTISGEVTGTTLYDVLYWHPTEANRAYYIDMSLCPVNARLYWKFVDGSEETVDVKSSKYVKAPNNAIAFTFSFFLRSGDAFENVTAKVKFLSLPNQYLQEGGVLQPTGDDTDRTADIEFMLDNYGECRLMAGDYYVSDVTVPDGCMVSGCGQRTRVYLSGEDAGSCFVLGSGCTIKDLELVDPLDETVIVPKNDLRRNGILFDQDTASKTLMKGTITNCHIRNFNGGGIRLNNTGVSSMGGLNISNCDIEKCYVGLYIERYSEFHRITNVSMTQNRFGTINNGGNNQYSCCGFNSNMYNFVIDNSDGTKINNSHGACVGCNFHHAVTKAIRITGSTSGFVFCGCNIDDNGMLVKDSSRIVFDGCNFMKVFSLSVDGQGSHNNNGTIENEGNLIIFSGSSFRKDFESIELANGAERNGVKFVGCFYQDGTEVNPE